MNNEFILSIFLPIIVTAYVVCKFPCNPLAKVVTLCIYNSTDGQDYQSIATVNLMFSSVNREIVTGISIINDDVDELPEDFFANLNLVTIRSNIIVDPSMATVNIDDDDGMCISTLYVHDFIYVHVTVAV